jgi:hypothetical protein
LELSEKIAQNLTSSRRNISGEQLHKCVFEVKEYVTVKDVTHNGRSNEGIQL